VNRSNDQQTTNLVNWIEAAGALADQGRFEESIAAYRRAIAASPNDAQARQQFAATLLQAGSYDEAISECSAALALQPDWPPVLNTLGVALAHVGRVADAIEALTAALRAHPRYANASYNLANVLARCGRRDEAIAAYRRALEIDPGLSHAAFNLAVLGATEVPPQMPRAYVSAFFNDYAPRFERHMAELHYVVPQLLAEVVLACGRQEFDEAVDLGCGTGLVGAQFRPLVHHFVGVDLAERMIAMSRDRGIYDELAQQEVVEYLALRETQVDLLLAADLLIYFGELESLFAAASARLRPSGLFAFSIESTAESDFQLRSSRRYAHSTAYVRRVAGRHDWIELVARECRLRDDAGGGESGVVFVFQAK